MAGGINHGRTLFLDIKVRTIIKKSRVKIHDCATIFYVAQLGLPTARMALINPATPFSSFERGSRH